MALLHIVLPFSVFCPAKSFLLMREGPRSAASKPGFVKNRKKILKFNIGSVNIRIRAVNGPYRVRTGPYRVRIGPYRVGIGSA